MNLKLSVPNNWQEDLLPVLKEKRDSISEAYGKLPADFVGGGRPSYSFLPISIKKAGDYIKRIHAIGIGFNYLLNSTCLNNLEWQRPGNKRLLRLVDWLAENNVDSVTVAIPYLLEVVKKRCPHIKVTVSTAGRVDSVERAKFWEGLGADRITLSSIDANRNFPMLRKIRGSVRCKLRLIANVGCMYNCAIHMYHCALLSHSSQNFVANRFAVDYSYIDCSYRRILEPVNLVRSDWIRPEDVHYYEEIGIDELKLVDRNMPTSAISLILDAYINRRYEGNLLDLFPSQKKTLMVQKLGIFHKLKFFFRPFDINILRLARARELSFDIFYMDNRKLDGFIDYFIRHDCRSSSCRECGYCYKVARDVIRTDGKLRQEAIKKYESYLSNIVSGKIFRYW